MTAVEMQPGEKPCRGKLAGKKPAVGPAIDRAVNRKKETRACRVRWPAAGVDIQRVPFATNVFLSFRFRV